MSLLYSLYNLVLDALFPLSPAEQELFSYSPKDALDTLPSAPPTPIEATSIFAYKDERVAKLIWNIKYKKSPQAIKIGGYALFIFLQNISPSKPIVIIPIPITARRRRERGFNQCELLIDEIARLDTENEFSFEKHLLMRTQHTSRHTLKNRADRLTDAKGIFAVDESVTETIPKDTQIVIIDDVITTGSTLKEALETVRSAGFTNVKGISLAH